MNARTAGAPDGDLDRLVAGVDLLCLDAGNTIVFFDHARLARLCARHGFATTTEALRRAEGEAKVAQERGEAVEVAWSQAGSASARSWAAMVGTMLAKAGLAVDRVPAALEELWGAHRARNLWSVVPDELVDSLVRLRATGVPVAVISNSEGRLKEFFAEIGLLRAVDCVVDSAVVGFEKPDPRIFGVALDRFGVPPDRALHLGDNFTTDVGGARAAGLRVALIDPLGHLAGRHPDVPRVAGAAAVADAIVRARA